MAPYKLVIYNLQFTWHHDNFHFYKHGVILWALNTATMFQIASKFSFFSRVTPRTPLGAVSHDWEGTVSNRFHWPIISSYVTDSIAELFIWYHMLTLLARRHMDAVDVFVLMPSLWDPTGITSKQNPRVLNSGRPDKVLTGFVDGEFYTAT